MCKLNKKNRGRYIDECLIPFAQAISGRLGIGFKTLGTCCGHEKYSMSWIVKHENAKYPVEIFSNKMIKRFRKFYKYDKQGYPYIPEVLEK